MSTYQKYYGTFERSYMGFTTISVMIQSIIGGIAAMAVLMHGNSLGQMFQLFLVVCGCVMFNGAVLSQQKPKVVFNILIMSFITCTIIAIINFAR